MDGLPAIYIDPDLDSVIEWICRKEAEFTVRHAELKDKGSHYQAEIITAPGGDS